MDKDWLSNRRTIPANRWLHFWLLIGTFTSTFFMAHTVAQPNANSLFLVQ